MSGLPKRSCSSTSSDSQRSLSSRDDRALEVALELQRQVRDLLQKHRTEQVKVLGDGVMLRSSNPRDAIRLGVRLLHGLADQAGFPPLRIGIHTGPALSSDGDWYGRTVNLAARLCAIAPSGEVIISEATRTTTGHMIDLKYSDRELHRLRNVSEAAVAAPESQCRPVGTEADTAKDQKP